MKERIKKIRKHFNLTQQEFADRLGLKRNSVANYEIGRNTPMDPIINSMCKEFGINEVWLRTGEGGDENMFTQISEDDRYSLNLGKLSVTENEFIKNGVNFLAETDPEKLKVLEEFMKAWLGIK
ncbi:helix-turn-helix domain-containing protein [[Clostridium] scindens]|uniref:helix-turn-helix domain-containing protein n=1 Tax=Clostridium scindens (strain JCM 10418 / VPI 12708) TaxID=29347 RepID=UPI001570FB2C|nr:helix-turn-helix transcriptional regulator [[Clostridium] scindens]NSI88068.1 helix-turn-helix transcriptional regulator [[Clostridium] scindens]NSJ02692.1 helix-turn-helix transcriptional regulator [[Clostridium] scindens]